MNNFILFINSFLSYALCFVLIVALVVVACILGAKLRKRKDVQVAVVNETNSSEQ